MNLLSISNKKFFLALKDSLFRFWTGGVTETQTEISICVIWWFVFLPWFHLFHFFSLLQLLNCVLCLEGNFWLFVFINFGIAFSFTAWFGTMIKWWINVKFLCNFTIIKHWWLDIIDYALFGHWLGKWTSWFDIELFWSIKIFWTIKIFRGVQIFWTV